MTEKVKLLAQTMGELRRVGFHYPIPNRVWEWIEEAHDAARYATCETAEDIADFDRIAEEASIAGF